MAKHERERGLEEFDILIAHLGHLPYVFHEFRIGTRDDEALAAVRSWGEIADVVIVRDESTATAYRSPTGPDLDVFDPVRVFWFYASSAAWTLRALLTLPAPGHPDAPRDLIAVERIGLAESAGRKLLRVRTRY
jgi:hypothetical protein